MTRVEVHAIRGFGIWTVAVYLPDLSRDIKYPWLIYVENTYLFEEDA